MILVYTSNTPIHFRDLDAGGVVYNATYLELCERVRNQWLSNNGCTFDGLWARGLCLAVRGATLNFRRPVASGEATITIEIVEIGKSSISLCQKIYQESKDGSPNFEATITLVSADFKTKTSCELPAELDFLKAY